MRILEIRKLPKSEMEISAELSAEEFNSYCKKSVVDLSRNAEIPGFRKGHVPEPILREKIGNARILQDAADSAVKEAYFNILASEKIEAIGRPIIAITKLVDPAAVLKEDSPLCFKIKIAVVPDVILGDDYKEIAKSIFSRKEEVFVGENEVESALDSFKEFWLKRNPGIKPEDFKLDDDFCRLIGNFQNVEELKNSIRENSLLEKKSKEKEKRKIMTLDGLIFNVSEIPDILIEDEKEKLLRNLKHDVERMGISWDDYLSRIGKSEAEITDEIKENSVKRIKYALVLDAIAKKENLDVSEEEIEKAVKEMTEHYSEEQKKNLDRNSLKGYVYDMLRNEKVFSLFEPQT